MTKRSSCVFLVALLIACLLCGVYAGGHGKKGKHKSSKRGELLKGVASSTTEAEVDEGTIELCIPDGRHVKLLDDTFVPVVSIPRDTSFPSFKVPFLLVSSSSTTYLGTPQQYMPFFPYDHIVDASSALSSSWHGTWLPFNGLVNEIAKSDMCAPAAHSDVHKQCSSFDRHLDLVTKRLHDPDLQRSSSLDIVGANYHILLADRALLPRKMADACLAEESGRKHHHSRLKVVDSEQRMEELFLDKFGSNPSEVEVLAISRALGSGIWMHPTNVPRRFRQGQVPCTRRTFPLRTVSAKAANDFIGCHNRYGIHLSVAAAFDAMERFSTIQWNDRLNKAAGNVERDDVATQWALACTNGPQSTLDELPLELSLRRMALVLKGNEEVQNKPPFQLLQLWKTERGLMC
eukprot:GILJ01002835.1.p1 GENE.GILJ01002835.1~~GILJ01002835.1.p1  ORF type:complete len:415 (+),score=56.89 GILJ01002835.1:36-1247(+)